MVILIFIHFHHYLSLIQIQPIWKAFSQKFFLAFQNLCYKFFQYFVASGMANKMVKNNDITF